MSAPQTVAEPQFLEFRTDQVVDHNYDSTIALSRALRIFLLSFGEYERICPQLYQQKFAEYMNVMKNLYGVQEFDQTMVQNEIKSLESQKIQMTIGVKLFRGRRLVTNPRIMVINGFLPSKWFALNTSRDLQTNVQYSEAMLFSDLKNYRRRKTDIVILLEADNWKWSWSQLKQFSIGYDQIPSEGFEDWFYFGRGVRLLIKINFKMIDKTDHRMASKFHLHSIIYMIRERLSHYRMRPIVGRTHRRDGRKHKITYIRKSLEPNTDKAFWSVPPTAQNLLHRIESLVAANDYSTIKTLLKQDVKFNDLQIGFRFTDNFNDLVCLCSEWCNWNSFFYYNPIYRFLLVQNNQLYLNNRTNVADIYLFASTFCAYEAGLNLQSNQIIPLTPVLRLINCANDYRTVMNQNFYLRIKKFKDQYEASFPNPSVLNGLTYNLIRNEIHLAQLWLQTDVNPFSEVCIETICSFYRLYSELHVWVSTRSTLVNKDNIRKWYKELDKTSRRKYRIYLKLGYDQRIAHKIPNYDFLFTEDYEYWHLSSDPSIKAIRNHIQKMGPNDNPFNVRVIYNDFLSTFVSIHKFIRIVEPHLPLATTFPSRLDLFQCFKTLDTDFNAFADQSEFDFKFDENMISQRNLKQMKDVLSVFFTLKHYSIASGIQSDCINSLILMKAKIKLRPEQTSTEFNFIWKFQLLEQTLRKDVPNLRLFEINGDIEQSFDEFYENFWGRADHEVNQSPQYAHNIASAYFQYQRLYFWWRNDGNNKFKFRKVLDSLRTGLEDISKQSEDIYETYILPSIHSISQTYDFHLEVLDVLVQYLVKADCYMLLTSMVIFLRKVHSLQMASLVKKRICYSMCKPGWVPIFRTMETCLRSVQRIETLYITFDDELNKISNLISSTKRMIKEIYRDLYKKIVSDWLNEINRIGGLKNLYPNSEEFISIHLAVGLSIMSALVDDFRVQSRFYRKFLITLLEYDSTDPHQQILNNYLVVCSEYLTQHQVIRTAMPLLWPMWQEEIAAVDWNDWHQMDGQLLQIDLNAADY